MSDPESAVLSKEDLEYIETRLAIVGFPVDLQCDEFRARIFRVRKTDMRDCLIVYVNGVFKHKWVNEDCEESRRFLRRKEKYVHKPKTRDKLKKFRNKYTKRQWEEEVLRSTPGLDPDAKFSYFTPEWPNWKSLRSHLVKNNKVIRLIRPDSGWDA